MTKREWTRLPCHECNGHGIVSNYGNGEDFFGPKECDCCNGGGTLWRSPRGALAVFPGGAFRGSDKTQQRRVA